MPLARAPPPRPGCMRPPLAICCADGVLAPLPGWLWLPAELWLIAPG